MFCDKLPKPLHGERMGFRLAYIKGNLMLRIFPVINNSIVHVHRIPHNKGEKAHRILMERFGVRNDNRSGFFIVVPAFRRHYRTGSTVYYLPPPLPVFRVYFQHIGIQAFHQFNPDIRFGSGVKRRHNIHLLNFVGICPRPLIIFPRCIICRIDFRIDCAEGFGKIRTVTVPYRIGAPAFHNLSCFRNDIHICRNSNPPLLHSIIFHLQIPFQAAYK